MAVPSFDELYGRLCSLPDTTHAEIISGELRILSPSRPAEQRASSRLSARLTQAYDFDSPVYGGWVFLPRPDLRLGDALLSPHLAAWCADRYVEPASGPCLVAPDWVCDAHAHSDRLALYGRHRVSHVWRIDPDARTLQVYRRQRELWLLVGAHAGDAAVRAEPFDAIELDLGALWRTPGFGPVAE